VTPLESAVRIVNRFVPEDASLDRAGLRVAIRRAIEEGQRQAQAWRPIAMKNKNGGVAAIQLHCSDEGTEIVAYNPIRNETAVFKLEPRKPVAKETSARKAMKA
jgi:hypothetical protein